MEGFVLHKKYFQYFRSLLRSVLLGELTIKLASLLCWPLGCLYPNSWTWGGWGHCLCVRLLAMVLDGTPVPPTSRL